MSESKDNLGLSVQGNAYNSIEATCKRQGGACSKDAGIKYNSYSKDVDDEGDTNMGWDSKADAKGDSENLNPFPKITITKIEYHPSISVEISSPLDLYISFELDRDVVAAHWMIKFLVDSCDKRLIKILGETNVEDYPDGESSFHFHTDGIDVSGISPSTLANSGLLMACFIVDGDEVATINMVVNIRNKDGVFIRDILNPLE